MPPRLIKKSGSKKTRPKYSAMRLRGMRDVECPRCGIFKCGVSVELNELALIRHTAAVGCDKLPLVRLPVLETPPKNNQSAVQNSFLPAGEPSISVFDVADNADIDDMNDAYVPSSPYEIDERMPPRKLLVEHFDESGFVAPSHFDEETPEQTASRLKDFHLYLYIHKMQHEMLARLGSDKGYDLRKGNLIEDFLGLSLFGIDANISYRQGDELLKLIRIIAERHYGTEKTFNLPTRWDTIVDGVNRKILPDKRMISRTTILSPAYFGVKDDVGKKIIASVVEYRDQREVIAEELLLMDPALFAIEPVVEQNCRGDRLFIDIPSSKLYESIYEKVANMHGPNAVPLLIRKFNV